MEVEAATATATGNGGHGGDKDPDRFCSICQASFNNAQMAQQHYSGKKHKKHLAKQDLMKLYGKPAAPGLYLDDGNCHMRSTLLFK